MSRLMMRRSRVGLLVAVVAGTLSLWAASAAFTVLRNITATRPQSAAVPPRVPSTVARAAGQYWEGEWICADCGYIYNERAFSNTKFEDQQQGFKCPACSAPRRRFARKLGDKIGTTLDGATMSIPNSEPCKLTQFGVGGDIVFTENEIEDWEAFKNNIKHLVYGHKRVPKFIIENASNKEVQLYWVNAEEGNKDNFVQSLLEYPVMTLQPGASDSVSTFVGHIFVAFDTATNQIFDFADVYDQKNCKFVVGERKLVNDSLKENFLDPHILDQQQKDGVNEEQILREYVYDSNMEVRMALSDTQVHFVPQVTDRGFEKAKLPKEMFQKISDFYFSNYNSSKTVIERDGGPLYNQRVIPTYHTPLPYGLKMNIFDELKQMMEEWSGLAPLVGTSIYGARTYTRGSYLHMHVDTADTHVVSGIVHIHHQNLEEPWPLEILDHDGRLNYINMDEGDFVFYESAKLLHGRPHPLEGDTYANMFVHYKPVSGWSVEF